MHSRNSMLEVKVGGCEEEFETNSSQLSLFIIMGLGITLGEEDRPTSLWQNCHFNVSSHAFLFSNCCARHTPLMQAVLKKKEQFWTLELF